MMLYLIIRVFSHKFVEIHLFNVPCDEYNLKNTFSGVFYGLGELLIFFNICLLIWLFLRIEDIRETMTSIKSKSILSKLTNKNYVNMKCDNDKTRFKVIQLTKDHLESLEGYLIGSLPIMILGLFSFTVGAFLHQMGADIERNEFDLDYISSIFLFITSLYTLIIFLVYQGGRQYILKEIKGVLKNTNHDKCLKIAKELDFHVDRPNFITSAILILFPIITLILKLFPIFF